ncbi:ABC transporter permease [Micromonospora arborensis]|uniref:ABC transporter permease n=1 Tax=Micromonospora arborensis TaxID=2116518 RepID=A0A318NPV7_9ACTN|nr:ABC transporter permease [Micromonospora arborensis]PYC71602.1 ABC transporter permease [Micromonospora arborensis]
MSILRAILAVFHRNLLLLRRERALIIQVVIVPSAMLILSTMVYGGVGDAYPVALVNQSSSAAGQQAEQAVRDAHSDIGPYFRIVTTDLAEARDELSWGRLHAVIVIPPDYDQTHRIQVDSFNVNSDAAKNYRGRIELAVNSINASGALDVELAKQTEHPDDVWRAAYLGGSSILLAWFFGSMLIAANLMLVEREYRTRKEILLTPLPIAAAGGGIILSAVLMATVMSLLPLALSYAIGHFEVSPGRLLGVYFGFLPVMVACAAFGLVLGYLLRHFRAAQPVVTLGAIMTFFVCGGFSRMAYLPEAAQAFARWWPFTPIFEWYNPVIHGFADLSAGRLTAVIAAAVVGLLLVPVVYAGEHRRGEERA